MTYQEIKDRLSKCEVTLEKIKDGTYTKVDSANIKETTSKLEVLRESLQKQLKEASKKTYLVTPKSGETAAVALDDDEADALKDADDIEGIKSADGEQVKEMKPGDPEDIKRKKMERLTPKDQETIAKIHALMQNANDIEEVEDTELPVPVDAEQDIETPEDGEDQEGDLDIGHQDDEPSMLKKDLYDIATYAAKLYKQLNKYDSMDGEVDFPHWWQKKVTLSREYLSSAQHYLEAEEKQPALDQLALEEGVEEASANKIKKEYDELVAKMKQLAQHYKTAEGEKKEKIVAALKQHTARKRELETALDKAVSGIGAGQELDSAVTEEYKKGFDTLIEAIKELNTDGDEISAAADAMEFIGQHYGIDFEFGAGPSRMEEDNIEEVAEMEWPEKVYSRHKDYLFRLLKVKDFRASYEMIDLENKNATPPRYGFQSPESLMKFAADHVRPQGGTQSTNLGETIKEEKSTCCGKCGRKHVKGTKCKTPYLKGKDHCRNN
jgi:hypothetical protein